MRAQWVCSRERRIALYKRSSIKTLVVISVHTKFVISTSLSTLVVISVHTKFVISTSLSTLDVISVHTKFVISTSLSTLGVISVRTSRNHDQHWTSSGATVHTQCTSRHYRQHWMSSLHALLVITANTQRRLCTHFTSQPSWTRVRWPLWWREQTLMLLSERWGFSLAWSRYPPNALCNYHEIHVQSCLVSGLHRVCGWWLFTPLAAHTKPGWE